MTDQSQHHASPPTTDQPQLHDHHPTTDHAQHHNHQTTDQAQPHDDPRTDDWLELRGGVPVLVFAPDGPQVATVQDALDVIGATYDRADVVALPATRLDTRFFTLGTGLAGEIMQKFVNYQIKLAIVGDISEHLAASSALRALVVESNRGRQIWFVSDLEDLDTHLSYRSS